VTAVHVVVPDGVDDPALPSGGNVYDRRICRGLADIGWSVEVCPVPGSWPRPEAWARTALAGVLARMPDHAVVLVDGLIASAVPEVLVPEATRLRLVVLVHMPLGAEGSQVEGCGSSARERAVLSAAAAIVTTSRWTERWLVGRYALRRDLVHVVEPGVDVADPASGTTSGGELLCVAAVTPQKGHDLLLQGLATVADRDWRCSCVGTLARDPGFVADLGRWARAGGIADRVSFTGPRSGADLEHAYATSDLLVLASRAETYGMVVTEALGRGLPVVATAVGGVPEALGRVGDGSRPGLLVPPDDPPAFGAALRNWLGDHELRRRLRSAAAERRATLSGWLDTSGRLSRVLAGVAR
jgi:glycosyltransferase involved in cell wall biosynthesis